MKIDLYNNTETFMKEARQDQAVRNWAYKHGISVDYLMDHPCIKDVVFLLDFRDEFQKEIDEQERELRSHADINWSPIVVIARIILTKIIR